MAELSSVEVFHDAAILTLRCAGLCMSQIISDLWVILNTLHSFTVTAKRTVLISVSGYLSVYWSDFAVAQWHFDFQKKVTQIDLNVNISIG